jgi:hypothetical protein
MKRLPSGKNYSSKALLYLMAFFLIVISLRNVFFTVLVNFFALVVVRSAGDLMATVGTLGGAMV